MNFAGLLAATAVGVACVAGGARAAPLEAYGALPTVSDVVVSPDGGKVAYITHVGDNESVIAMSISPAARLVGTNYGPQKLRQLIWADPQHLLVVRSTTRPATFVISAKQEWYLLDSIDVVKNKSAPLLRKTDLEHVMNVIEGEPMVRKVNGRPAVFVSGVTFVEGEGSSMLFDIDPATSEATRARGTMTGLGEWVVDAEGSVLAGASYNEAAHRWKLWLNRDGQWSNVYSVDTTIDTPSIMGLSPDGAAVILRMIQDGKYVYRPVSLKDGVPGQPIAAYQELSDVIPDPATHRIVGGARIGTTTEYVFFDPKDQAAWNSVVRAFPDEDVELASWSDDRSQVVVRVTGPVHGIAYVLIDTKARHAMKVGDAYAGLKPEDLAAVEAVEYRASDGRKIPAYLTLPNGRGAKGLPLIVLPHGGPADMDPPGFDWWAQALASRGYAVLQPEFRGSDGYGWDFLAAGFGQWGRKMQSDLSDGVRALAADGLVDPKRVCVVGASYGGYAALAGATLESGVYRCAVSISGISDLRRFLAWDVDRAGSAFNPNLRYWDRYMGVDEPSDPALDQISPIKHLDKVSIPILLIHGKDDTVVPIEQSQLMAAALTKAGKPVEFVTLPGEDHWLSRSGTRLQMLQATVKFLETNNPPS